MNQTLKRNVITHSLSIIGFLAITFLVHYPSVFQGKRINQHDILQGAGGNFQLREYKMETGIEPLWNNNMFSGMPAYLTGVGYSGDLMVYVYRFISLGLTHPTSILFISFVSFYLLLLTYKVRPLIAFLGSILFGLNGFNIISIMAGHNAKIAAVSLMPLVLAGVNLVFQDKKWIGAGLTALALSLQIKTNHPQITYYLALIIFAYGLNELVKVTRGKLSIVDFSQKAALLLFAALLAVGANFGRLSTTLEYSKYSIRGQSELSKDLKESSGLDREYAFRYSNGIAEPLFLFVPNVFGGSSQQELSTKSEVAKVLRQNGYNRSQIAQQVKAVPTYWGSQPLTAPYYAGTIAVLLFILGIVILERKEKVWLIAIIALGIVMSWGKNFEFFNNLLFDFLPGYNKFRSVTFTIIMSILGITLLGCLGLERLLSGDWSKERKNKLLVTFGIAGGFLVLLLLASGAFSYRGAVDSQVPDWFANAIRSDRKSLLIKDALRALFFIALFGAASWAYFSRRVKELVFLLILCLVAFIDSFSLSKRFLNDENFADDPFKEFFAPTEADKLMMSSAEPGQRVLNLQNPFNENRTSYYHESIGGYHGAKIRRYQDVIDAYLQNELQEAYSILRSQSTDFADLQVLNMLNTTFLYAGTERNTVFKNNDANGNAWIVNEIIPVNSADEEISKLGEIDTKRQAVIDQTKFQLPKALGNGSIELVKKTPNKLTYHATIAEGAATAIFSEVFYPKGWNVTIDTETATMLRANYLLRALEIPEGEHTITFEFTPTIYTVSNTVMLTSGILVLLMFVGGIYLIMKTSY
ncbi:MAG: YfhO family protein [Bacteroidota bacterium]